MAGASAGGPPADERGGASLSSDVERSEDGRYIVVDGRRWRASDPGIPERLRSQLVRELMGARRAVRAAGGRRKATSRARARVHDAKLALGERGEPWWEEGSTDGRRQRIEAAARCLIRSRAADATICPSEVARVVGGPDWRAGVPEVREVIRQLARRAEIRVLQSGAEVDLDTARGPIRLGRGPKFPGTDHA